MPIQIVMGVQDSRGRGNDIPSPWLQEWMRIRSILNGKEQPSSLSELGELSVVLRIGGRINDFDGGYGPERRRLMLARGYVTCDMVVQSEALGREPGLFDEDQARQDFLRCIDWLLAHPKLAPFKEDAAALRRHVESMIEPES